MCWQVCEYADKCVSTPISMAAIMQVCWHMCKSGDEYACVLAGVQVCWQVYLQVCKQVCRYAGIVFRYGSKCAGILAGIRV